MDLLVPTLFLTILVKQGKLPAMYNCVKCVYIYVVASLMFQFLWISVGFKTSRMMFTQGRKYVTWMCACFV